MLTAVTGINWGDEGKGRVIDLLAENADIVARYQGGNNAGHTVVTEKGKFILNLLPSGILHPEVTCVLGTGMVIDLEHLAGEMEAIEARGVKVEPENLKLSDKATISMPWHKVQDGLEEDRLAKKGSAFGSTRRGICLRLQRQVPQKDPASGRPFASGRGAHPEPSAHDPGRQKHGAGGLLSSGAHELRCPAELVQAAGSVLCALHL